MRHPLLEKFEAGLGRLEQRRLELEETPWILFAGEPGVGKTSLLLEAGLAGMDQMEFANPSALPTEGMDWWFGKEAMVLDTSGEWLISHPGVHPAWTSLFQRWKGARANTSLNAAVFCVSSELFQLKPSDPGLREAAVRLASMANALSTGLDQTFPVLLALTKADLLPGFSPWFSRAGHRNGDFPGWASADTSGSQPPLGTIHAALSALQAQVREKRMPLLGDPSFPPFRTDTERDAWFWFPELFRTAMESLQSFLRSFHAELSGHHKPWVGGVYLTSARPWNTQPTPDEPSLFCREVVHAHLLPLAQSFRWSPPIPPPPATQTRLTPAWACLAGLLALAFSIPSQRTVLQQHLADRFSPGGTRAYRLPPGPVVVPGEGTGRAYRDNRADALGRAEDYDRWNWEEDDEARAPLPYYWYWKPAARLWGQELHDAKLVQARRFWTRVVEPLLVGVAETARHQPPEEREIPYRREQVLQALRLAHQLQAYLHDPGGQDPSILDTTAMMRSWFACSTRNVQDRLPAHYGGLLSSTLTRFREAGVRPRLPALPPIPTLPAQP